MEKVRIVREGSPAEADLRFVQDAIDRYNVGVTGRSEWSPLAIFLRGENGQILGGVTGDFWGEWLHLKVLWVAERLRRQGYGSQLLAAAEEDARRGGCSGIFLETFSFQAPDFYARHGYQEFGRLDGYPPGHSQHYMHKRLSGR